MHFLRFDRGDYARLGNLIKCNPAIKDASDREGAIAALAGTTIDILATDHATAHAGGEVEAPTRRRRAACRWCSTRWSRRWNWCTKASSSSAQVVQKFAHALAQLFDVAERGFLREGNFADLVLVDDTPFTVRREDVLSKCAWSPFRRHDLPFAHRLTWVNGHRVGRRQVGEPAGSRLAFAR